ncbi:MAG TPA: nucleotidyltransferase family protein [Pyrinomonadaceae bacterium]|nr:nucleotidyltransferase family protein [Pyrinomonadaceae bacterium]
MTGDPLNTAGDTGMVELILCSARTRLSAEMVERIRQLASGNLDWQRLLRTAAGHGVMPLVYMNLKAACPDLPQKFTDAIENNFYTNSIRNHMLTEELCRVLNLLESNGLAPVTYKGPALAIEIYGDLALRQFNDLDVMIRERDVAAASRLLRALGYRQEWELTPAQEAAYIRYDCERLFSLGDAHVFMDIHWDFVRRYFPLKLNQEHLRTRLVTVSLGCAQAKTFSPEDLLIILCVHACKDLWTKLIWIVDVAELIAARPSLDWARIMKEAESARAMRMLLLGLFLARTLLGADVPEAIFQRAMGDGSVAILAASVRARLFSREEIPASREEFLFHLRLNERFQERAAYAVRYAMNSNPADWSYVRVPDSLFFLYRLIRPVRLIIKQGQYRLR